MTTNIQLTCKTCKKTFERQLAAFNSNKNKLFNVFCSTKCTRTGPSKTLVQCTFCGKPVNKLTVELKRSPKPFCNKSCATSYRNANKTTGFKRSKLEILIQKQLTLDFPSLLVLYNNRTEIGIELDFYFPTLRFALELNGPTHYEPIYGKDKFDRIVEKDKQKQQICNSKGIELMIIDASSKEWGTKLTLKLFPIIMEQIKQVIGRDQISI
jgi:endogenous inhibitor of DNA gyrase (YacG/DUF329 family)